MIVKIVQGDYYSSYACNGFHVAPMAGNPDEVCVSLVSTTEGFNREMVLDKRRSYMFVMNDNGKTIDSFMWAASYVIQPAPSPNP